MPPPTHRYIVSYYSSWDIPYQGFEDWLNDRAQEGLAFVDSVQTINLDGTMSTRICTFVETP